MKDTKKTTQMITPELATEILRDFDVVAPPAEPLFADSPGGVLFARGVETDDVLDLSGADWTEEEVLEAVRKAIARAS